MVIQSTEVVYFLTNKQYMRQFFGPGHKMFADVLDIAYKFM